MKRYVWLNMNTGEFSNSWGESDQKHVSEDMLEQARSDNWKLLEYTCLTDGNFELYNLMQIVTKTKNPS